MARIRSLFSHKCFVTDISQVPKFASIPGLLGHRGLLTALLLKNRGIFPHTVEACTYARNCNFAVSKFCLF